MIKPIYEKQSCFLKAPTILFEAWILKSDSKIRFFRINLFSPTIFWIKVINNKYDNWTMLERENISIWRFDWRSTLLKSSTLQKILLTFKAPAMYDLQQAVLNINSKFSKY